MPRTRPPRSARPAPAGAAAVAASSAGGSARLLALACDWWWRLDADHRLTGIEGRALEVGPHALAARLGQAPWQWAGVAEDDGGIAALRSALDDRHPFRDLEHGHRDPHGLMRYTSLSGEPVLAADGAFAGFRGTARDVTARRRSQALTQLEHAVTRGLASAETERRILQTVTRVLCESEHWETGGFFRAVDAEGTCRLEVGWEGPGMPAEAIAFYRRSLAQTVPTGGLLSRAIRSGEPVWHASLAESATTWATRVRETGERATFVTPVRVDGRVLGVFAFASREIREPDAPLLATMRVVGEQVGQFLQRKTAERVLRESEARFRAMTELSSDWYWECGADFRFTRLEGREIEGGAGSAAIGRARWELDLEIEDDGGWAAHRAVLAACQPFRDVVLARRDGDAVRYLRISGEPLLGRDGDLVGYRGIGREITAQRLAEKRIEHLATHDGLTGLPNRALFNEQLDLALRRVARDGRRCAVLFIDLDRFKGVNDSHGHDVGDAVLRAVAERLLEHVRGSEVTARLGGDEFVVLLHDVADVAEIEAIARKLLAAIAVPIRLGEGAIELTASIGVALHSTPGEDRGSLLRAADLAMYAAKEDGRNRVRLGTPPAAAAA